jgi:hypothetical protein
MVSYLNSIIGIEYGIFRQKKNGDIISKILAKGYTPEQAWKNFNDKQAYLNYRDTTIFTAAIISDVVKK